VDRNSVFNGSLNAARQPEDRIGSAEAEGHRLSSGQASSYGVPADDIFAIDTKGAHPLSEAATRKLLWIELPRKAKERLFVKLVSVGKWNTDTTQETKDGYTLWGIKAGPGRTVRHFNDLDELLTAVLTARRG
jgi:hypothetical protein